MQMPALPKLDELIQSPTQANNANKPTSGPDTFSSVLGQALQSVASDQYKAADMAMQAAQGENVPMHDVISAISRAETTLQTMTTVRDRAVEAYQQIQRMPI